MLKPIRVNIPIWIHQEWFHCIGLMFAQMFSKSCLGSLTPHKVSAIKNHCYESGAKSLGIDECNQPPSPFPTLFFLEAPFKELNENSVNKFLPKELKLETVATFKSATRSAILNQKFWTKNSKQKIKPEKSLNILSVLYPKISKVRVLL